MAASSARRNRPLFVVFLTIAIDLIGFGMIVPLLPLYAKAFGATGAQAGWLFAAYSGMQVVFSPLWGRLSDRIGRRPVLLISIAGNVFALVLLGTAQSYLHLLAARLVGGLFAANIGVANAYVADVTPPADRARGMGVVGAAFGIGFVIGPFLGGELSPFGYDKPALVAAGLAVLNWFGALLFLPESLPPEGRAEQQTSILAQRLSVLRVVDGIVPLLVIGFLQFLAASMGEIAFVLFAKARLGFDVREAGRVFGYAGVIMVVVQGVLVGPTTRRFGERRQAVAGLLLITVGTLCLPLSAAGGWPLLIGVMTVLALGQGFANPSLTSILSRAAPAHMQGVTLGLSRSVGSLARVVGPPLAGVLFDTAGAPVPFLVGAAVTLAATLLAAALLPRPQAFAATATPAL